MEKYYRHFKGNVYRVLHIAKHTETLEDMVVYQAMYGDRDIWIRPKAMFEEVEESPRHLTVTDAMSLQRVI